MAEVKMSKEGEKMLSRFGVVFPIDTIQRLDELKGYYSRNKFILKIVEEYLQGAPSVGSPQKRQAVAPTYPTTEVGVSSSHG